MPESICVESDCRRSQSELTARSFWQRGRNVTLEQQRGRLSLTSIACLAIYCAVVSCGGRATTTEEENPASIGELTNREAAALARAEGGVPATAHLVHIRSGSGGFQNANGRDRRWTVIFWDATNKVSYLGEVRSTEHEEPIVAIMSDDREFEECALTDQLVLVDSARVVPDAISRLPEGYPVLYMHLSEEAACFSQPKPASTHQLIVNHPPQDAQYSQYYYSQFYYTDEGSLLQQCGPCDKQIGCTNCSD